MHSIRIVGAGSIGNHLTHAARVRGWKVTLTDIDAKALNRARDDIYPSRYGAWDEEIVLKEAGAAMGEPADVVFIGTPPDTHLPLALETLKRVQPKILLTEKPLGGPDLALCQDLLDLSRKNGVFCAVGYNHCLARITSVAEKFLQDNRAGRILTISARAREHWLGIFNAHPWLAGPSDSYLGFSKRGGGALGEHSHAVNIWQHFAHLAGAGRVSEVSATLDMVSGNGVDYDRAAFLTLKTEAGLVGDVIQDVVTHPAEKSARLQGETGFIEWKVNAAPGKDMVVAGNDGGTTEEIAIEKTRADDFIAEIDHLGELLADPGRPSPISLQRGLDTMMVIAAAFRSNELRRNVRINWEQGYVPEAII